MGNREHHRAFVLAVISDRNREIFARRIITRVQDTLCGAECHFGDVVCWIDRDLLSGGGRDLSAGREDEMQ